MKLIAILLAALVAAVAGESAKQLESLPQEAYTARALAELKEMSKSRFLTDLQTPTCSIDKQNNAIDCSLKFRWMKVPRTIGIRVSFDLHRVQLKFILFFDDEEMFEHKIDLAKICVPLPGLLKQIKICGQAYYVDIDTKPPRLSFDACFVIKIGDFFHLRLNCVRLDKQGRFSHHAKYQPEDEGIFMLSIEDGNLKFKINNPIPKEVMDQIEKGWKDFEKGAKDAVDTAGKELNQFGKDVEKGVNQVGKDIEKGTKDVIDKAGKELNQFGKDVEEGVNKVGKDIEKGVQDAGEKIKDTFTDIGNKFTDFFG